MKTFFFSFFLFVLMLQLEYTKLKQNPSLSVLLSLFFFFRIEALMNLCLSEDQVKNVCGDLIEQVLPLA